VPIITINTYLSYALAMLTIFGIASPGLPGRDTFR